MHHDPTPPQPLAVPPAVADFILEQAPAPDPSPLDVAAALEAHRFASIFEPYTSRAGIHDTPGQRRSRLRDQLVHRLERTQRALAATRGSHEDLDLALELCAREVARLDVVLHEYSDAMHDAGDLIPSPHRDQAFRDLI